MVSVISREMTEAGRLMYFITFRSARRPMSLFPQSVFSDKVLRNGGAGGIRPAALWDYSRIKYN